jgi:transposase
MEVERSRKRRRYSREVKAQILAECKAPGASVAKVALSHGINANIVHGWRKRVRDRETAPTARHEFIPLAVAPAVQTRVDERGIELEVRRGTVTLKLLWPMSAAAELAAWTRELLR